ncbi:acetolactate synthase [Blattabacterium cuenoti]|uniref:acetolactate synthase n=1 Tax=Blattabacterium cuenoti TaxID=1653831 RepID=UPI00163C1E41|nr:acetolactate synthase [Blattabacterium cuenoti]
MNNNSQFRIRILGENNIRLLSRILIIVNRKNLKINYINMEKYEIIQNKCNRYILDLECKKTEIIQLKKLTEKLIGIIDVSFLEKEKK